VKGSNFAATLWQDVRYGLRMMARTPGFTAVAVITLAVCIGANTAVFSLIEAVMFRSLPVQDPSQLVILQWSAHKSPKFKWYTAYGDTKEYFRRDGSNPVGTSFSLPFLEELEKSNIFSSVAAFAWAGPLSLSRNGAATSVVGQLVNEDFFHTLGVHAAVGRLLGPDDDQPSSPPALVLNYDYWQRAFGGSPSAIGKVINLNGVPFTIVGVADKKFVSLSLGNVYDLWVPLRMAPRINTRLVGLQSDGAAWWLLITARLKPGVPESQQQAAMDLLFQNQVLHSGQSMLEETDEPRILLAPAENALVGSSIRYADSLRVLMIAVGIVLLIGCANVAGLLLARATTRQREIAVRLALGARRSRLLRQLLTESVTMAAMGGALGVALASWGAHIMLAMAAASQARPLGVNASLDGSALAFTSVVSLLTGIFFGLAPALRGLRPDLTPALKASSGALKARAESRHRWFNMGNALVVLQGALAIVVLMGAGLLVHTLSNLNDLNPGFDTRNTLTFDLNPTVAGYKPTQIDNLYRELRQQIGAMPGVIGVSYSAGALLSGSWWRNSVTYLPPGGFKKVTIEMDYMPVGIDFFSTMRIPLLAGRTLNEADFELVAANHAAADARPGAEPSRALTVPVPVIVNQEFARKYFQGVNVLGKEFGADDGGDTDNPRKHSGYVIVGVVQDAKYNNLRREIAPTMYAPLTGQYATFEVRTASDPRALVPELRNLVNQHNSNLPLTRVFTQTELIDMLLAQERLIARVSSFFALLALLLACIGLYGLLSFEVTRRTREIGIRMALGAQRADLIGMVVAQSIALVLAGSAIGVSAAILLGHLTTKLLYGVKPGDPVTLLSVALLLILVALAAASIPARRTTTVDPMIALRCE